MKVAVDELRGREVLDITGRVLGRVGRMTLESESWAIDSFQLKLGRNAARELGLSYSIFRVPTVDIPTGLVMGASEAVILRAALDELQPLVEEEVTEPLLLPARTVIAPVMP
jgi:sporulation protein YlmC with PRC-barrel domain